VSIFAIADLHLSLSVNKPMDVFGNAWEGYMGKIYSNWIATVGYNDYVIIAGDISWAINLEQAIEDLKFIHSLPGKKILLKGNHDYWWSTTSKMESALKYYNLSSINLMHNNSYKIDNYIICGTRGWKTPGDDSFEQHDLKMYQREISRLELSLNSSNKTREPKDILIVAMHYPPFNFKKEPSGFVDLMIKHKTHKCVYGHLHGASHKTAVTGLTNGIEFALISADFLKFIPIKL